MALFVMPSRIEGIAYELRIPGRLYGLLRQRSGRGQPQSCTVPETLNGEWELTLVHPIDEYAKA